MPLLALDLGTKAGWAVQKPDGSRFSGAADFTTKAGEGNGMKFRRFKQLLQELKDACGGEITAVIYEEAQGGWKGYAEKVYGGFLAILQEWCEMYGIPYYDINPSTLKKWATGNGHAKKDAMLAFVQRNGFDVKNDNEADAIAVLLWATVEKPHEK